MNFNGFDFTDFVNNQRSGGSPGGAPGGGAFRDIFSQFFGGRESGASALSPERGSDLEYGLNVGFWNPSVAPRSN